MQHSLTEYPQAQASATDTRFKVLGAISFSHFLNDPIRSLVCAFLPQRSRT